MNDEEIRRLAERIRQSGTGGSSGEPVDDAIPMLTEVVDERLPPLGQPADGSGIRPSAEPPARTQPEPAARPQPGPPAGPESDPVDLLDTPIDPSVLSDDALIIALEVRIADQVLGRLLANPVQLDGAVDGAMKAAATRLAETLAGELRLAVVHALREQLEPTVREAVREAVQEAVRGIVAEQQAGASGDTTG